MKTFDSYSFAPWWVAQLKWLDEDEMPWRETRAPGSDISDLPPEVQNEINARWTPKLIADYQAWLADPEKWTGGIPGPVTPTPKQARLAREAKAALDAKLAEYEVGEFVEAEAKEVLGREG